jgi:hypothetical protein
MEAQLNVLAQAIRDAEESVNKIQKVWEDCVERLGVAQMPAPLQPALAYREGLKEAWKIMTHSEWPED